MSGFSKAFGSIMLFILTLLSYTPLKVELVAVSGNSSLSNAGIQMINSMFGIIWALLMAFWLGLAFYYATKS